MCCHLAVATVSRNKVIVSWVCAAPYRVALLVTIVEYVLWICAAPYRLSLLVTIGCSITAMCCPISVVPDSHNSGGIMDMCCPHRSTLLVTIVVVLWICAAPYRLSLLVTIHCSGVVLWMLCAAPYRVTLLVTIVV